MASSVMNLKVHVVVEGAGECQAGLKLRSGHTRPLEAFPANAGDARLYLLRCLDSEAALYHPYQPTLPTAELILEQQKSKGIIVSCERHPISRAIHHMIHAMP